MPSFLYTAISNSGRKTSGIATAPSKSALLKSLRKQGCLPLRVKQGDSKPNIVFLILNAEVGWTSKRSSPQLSKATRELAVMLAAGQDLDRALRFVSDIATTTWVKETFRHVRDEVRGGRTLATALEKHPRIFSRVYIGLVRAGEAGGTLAPALGRLALMLDKQKSLNATIITALLYPLILVIGGVSCIVLLLTQVVPSFVPSFEQAGVELPLSTRTVMSIGQFVSSYGVYCLAMVLIAWLITKQLFRYPGPRLSWDRFLLRLPVIGKMTTEIHAARFTRTLGALLLSGVPIVAALGVAADATGNSAVARAVKSAADSASRGDSLSQNLEKENIMPLRTIYLLRLGEETAQLGSMSLRAAELHEEECDIIIKRATELAKPLITCLIGLAVAGVVASMLAAMLAMNDLVQS